MKLVKIRALRGFGIGAGRFLDVGDIGELLEAEALLRIQQGKAELFIEKEKPKSNGGKKK